LLSTYNGGEFLADQIRSLSAQSYPATFITIRDDGSTDGTYQKVCEHVAGSANVKVIRGENLGAAASFLDLLASAGSECEYFAFADQDDIWMASKLENAVSQMTQTDSAEPTMYCSRQEYVDERLKHLGFSRIPRQIGFGNALVENIATGCTVVLNQEARRIIVERQPSRLLMHDWWCYLVVSAFGKVIYDERPSVKYRLHGQNAIGAPTHAGQKLLRGAIRFLNYRKDATTITDQALEFKHCFGDLLNEQNSSILEKFLGVRSNIWSRMTYSTQMGVWRQSRFDNLILRTMILIGRV
jgi:glycosyltransferase involved in cell wall biosynthesis